MEGRPKSSAGNIHKLFFAKKFYTRNFGRYVATYVSNKFQQSPPHAWVPVKCAMAATAKTKSIVPFVFFSQKYIFFFVTSSTDQFESTQLKAKAKERRKEWCDR